MVPLKFKQKTLQCIRQPKYCDGLKLVRIRNCRTCLPAFSRPRYEGWPHHEQSFSTDVCLPHSLLVLSVTTQSTILCCLSVSSWVYLECGSLGLYLVLIPSPGSPLSQYMPTACQFHFFHWRKEISWHPSCLEYPQNSVPKRTSNTVARNGLGQSLGLRVSFPAHSSSL